MHYQPLKIVKDIYNFAKMSNLVELQKIVIDLEWQVLNSNTD